MHSRINDLNNSNEGRGVKYVQDLTYKRRWSTISSYEERRKDWIVEYSDIEIPDMNNAAYRITLTEYVRCKFVSEQNCEHKRHNDKICRYLKSAAPWEKDVISGGRYLRLQQNQEENSSKPKRAILPRGQLNADHSKRQVNSLTSNYTDRSKPFTTE